MGCRSVTILHVLRQQQRPACKYAAVQSLVLTIRHCTVDSLIAICKVSVPSLLVAMRRCLKGPLLHMHIRTAESCWPVQSCVLFQGTVGSSQLQRTSSCLLSFLAVFSSLKRPNELCSSPINNG